MTSEENDRGSKNRKDGPVYVQLHDLLHEKQQRRKTTGFRKSKIDCEGRSWFVDGKLLHPHSSTHRARLSQPSATGGMPPENGAIRVPK